MGAKTVSLRRYLARRMLEAVPLVIGVIAINFTIIHLAPGDPVYRLVGEYGATPEMYAEMRQKFGLDKPLYEQLLIYLVRVAYGDLGYSLGYQTPVIQIIVQRIPATLLLMFVATIVSASIGIVLGAISSQKPGSIRDNVISISTLLGYAMPTFWLGQILLLVFGLYLGLLPIGGISSLRVQLGGIGYYVDIASHLVLPATTLGLFHLALIARISRASMIEVLSQDYVTAARARGLSDWAVMRKHVLKNASLPTVTVIGMNLGVMFGGAIVTEMIFAWPGLGRLIYDAIGWRDYPLVLGAFLVISLFIIVTNLITDITYMYLDPRILYK